MRAFRFNNRPADAPCVTGVARTHLDAPKSEQQNGWLPNWRGASSRELRYYLHAPNQVRILVNSYGVVDAGADRNDAGEWDHILRCKAPLDCTKNMS